MIPELLIGILGLVAGFLLGRLGPGRSAQALGQQRAEEGLAYIRGVNFLLAKEPERAIAEFVKAVKLNSDTVEAYLALGNLFRSQGDPARAVRVHQSITCRPGLPQEVLVQALYELAQDYKECGLLEQAKKALEDLLGKAPKMLQAWLLLQEVQGELGEWEEALRSQEKISKLRKGEDPNAVAHLWTELGKLQMEKGDLKAARSSLKKAISTNKLCLDAYLHLGDLYAQEGSDPKAIAMWKQVLDLAPEFTFLAYDRLEHAFFRLGQVSGLEVLLRSHTDGDPVLRLYLARHLRKKGELKQAAHILEGLLQERPGWMEARKDLIQIYSEQGSQEQALSECRRLASCVGTAGVVFTCSHCGHECPELLWKCPGCKRWDTLHPREGLELDVLRGQGAGVSGATLPSGRESGQAGQVSENVRAGR